MSLGLYGLQHPCLRDGKRVLECLQRSLRIVDACSGSSSTHVPLFLEILEAVRWSLSLVRIDI